MNKAGELLKLLSEYCKSKNGHGNLNAVLAKLNSLFPKLDFKYSFTENRILFDEQFLNNEDFEIVNNTIGSINNILKDEFEYTKKIQLNRLFSNLPGAVFKCLNDHNYTMIYLSDKIESICGYKKEELLEGKNYTYDNLILKEDRKLVWESIQNSFKNNEAYDIEYRIKTKVGKIKWLWEKGEVFKVNDEEFIEGFILDVSANRKVQKDLSVSEQRYQDLVNNSLEGIFVVEGNKIVFANSASYEISGYSKMELYEKNFTELIYKDDVEMIVRNNTKRYASEDIEPYDFRMITKSGEILWLHINATKIKWKGKGAILCFVTDVTKRKQYEIDLKQMNEELIFLNKRLNNTNEELTNLNKKLTKARKKAEESDKMKSVFLANMSHEIRTPMNGILGFIKLINDGKIGCDKQKQLLAMIEKSGFRMLNLLNNLLEVSQIESGDSKVFMNENNLYELLTKDFDYYGQLVDSGEVKFEYDEKDFHKNESIYADEIKIQHVLGNLIRNAIKYTKEGFIKYGCIKDANEDYLFYVKDSGLGIEKEKHKIIFNRFAQANLDPVKSEEGAGLGLSIAKAFVEMHNGKIWLESDLGKGTNFYFTVPHKQLTNK